MAKALRRGKALIDWSQNTEHKSMVCAWLVDRGLRRR
jgi:DNA primase